MDSTRLAPLTTEGPRPRARRPRRPWQRAAAWGAGLVLAGTTVVVGCRAFGTDGVTPVPQTLAFLPLLLVPGGLALALAALGRWWTGVVWAVLVLAVTGWFLRPYGTGSTGAHGPVAAQVRVLTSNVEFGDATGELIAALARERPDVVFVQECDLECTDALDAEVSRAEYPYRDVARLDGSRGSAILSRFPLGAGRTVPSVMAQPGATATIAGRPVLLQLAHPMPPLPFDTEVWERELRGVRDFAAGAKGSPTILAGDFNASQDHAGFRDVLRAGDLHDAARLAGHAREWSWPADRSTVLRTQIDHVLVSDHFSVRGVRFLTLGSTDHRAVLVDLDLREA